MFQTVLAFIVGMIVGCCVVLITLWILPSGDKVHNDSRSYHLLRANSVGLDTPSFGSRTHVEALRPSCPYFKGHRSRFYCGVGCHYRIPDNGFIVTAAFSTPLYWGLL